MNGIQLQIMLIASFASIAMALPGNFLILRGVAMMSDAISHSVLFGIACMFLLIQNLHSPLLLFGAALTGLATVFLTESVLKTSCLKQDAAIGVIFPFFFSAGVILISIFARDVHLDLDIVILGEIAFAPFNRLILSGIDCGPIALWSMGFLVLINAVFILLFFKELKVSIFDQDFAFVGGLRPQYIYYFLMMITSITAVGAFDVVGSVVVVALMITPAATAYILTKRLEIMVFLSVIISVITSIIGYFFAYWLDVSIAGSMATWSGIVFIVALLGSERGLIAYCVNDRLKRILLAEQIVCKLLVSSPSRSLSMVDISQATGWNERLTYSLVRGLQKKSVVTVKDALIELIC